MLRKAEAFSAFLANDKERETTNTAEQFGDFSFQKQLLLFPQPFLVTDITDISNEAKDT